VGLRVIGGEWRGRRLLAPAGRDTRPTSERVREAIFDILGSLALSGHLPPPVSTVPRGGAAGTVEAALGAGHGLAPGDEAGRGGGLSEAGGQLAGCTVIDVFAGSGALGIEALSRGADSCVFVESGAAALRALRRNLSALGVPPARARVLASDAGRALEGEIAAGRRYTLLLADPPYADLERHQALLTCMVPLVLDLGGLAVVETARRVEPRVPLATLATKTYGDTRVTVLCNERRREAAGREDTATCPTR